MTFLSIWWLTGFFGHGLFFILTFKRVSTKDMIFLVLAGLGGPWSLMIGCMLWIMCSVDKFFNKIIFRIKND